MATTCQPQELMDNAAGFAAMPAGFYYPIKLALLCRWLKQLNPDADCSPQALMTAGACFACLPPGFWPIMRLQLLCQILAGGGGGGGCANAVAVTGLAGVGSRGSTEFGYLVDLTWNAHAHPEILNGFRVYRDDIEATNSPVAPPNSNGIADTPDTTGFDPRPQPNTTYTYKVCGTFNNGCPDTCAQVQVDVGCYVVAPDGLQAEPTDPGVVHLFWDQPIAPLHSFTIEWGTTMGGPYPFNDVGEPQPASFNVQALTSGVTYYFRVRANDTNPFNQNACVSAWSNEASALVS